MKNFIDKYQSQHLTSKEDLANSKVNISTRVFGIFVALIIAIIGLDLVLSLHPSHPFDTRGHIPNFN